MKRLEVDLPDALAREIEQAVRSGWFESEGEVVRVALRELVRRQRFELLERQQREDIAWVLRQKGPNPTAAA